MELIINILSLVGSLALFLFGMKTMSEGLEKFAGDRLRSILAAMTRNRVMGVLTGILITALIQSSSAVMKMMGMCAVVGFSFNLRAIWNPDISPIITSSRISE